VTDLTAPLPVGRAIERGVDGLLDHGSGLFDAVAWVIGLLARGLESALLAAPAWSVVTALTLLAFWRVGLPLAAFTALGLGLVVGMDLWTQTMETLALVLSATALSLSIGLPVGIWAGLSDVADRVVRPVLDFMQTMPAFVYLIPAVMFFGLGRVPGTVATVIFATPPAVRLTSLGIRSVPREMVEAGVAFGCTRPQLLFAVQIPNALPSIMAGINQNTMLALSMVVIASMIGAGGLGGEVLRGIQRLDVGVGFEGGIGVVILAIILDRITQSFARRPQRGLVDRVRALVRGERGS
jgi:glycine betaine/proline transport system permease protein